ncbi:anaphase-promoting complex subunit 6-like [Dorcoceras hygrometricum]|uniref:Anaphase-promoting complex subunit 6-like n=1 Tax=Dorcoceras hygrometricum TaxID=472368 RepID=A0A2Z7BZB9_9LAMI|nr:anaphase-promoting complex subunit 6-like [Dorcoceras hygrometricum]
MLNTLSSVSVRNHESSTCVTLNGSGIQLAMGPQPLWLRNHNFGLAQRIMIKSLATSPHDPLGITDSACKNQLVVVGVQYDPFNTYIPIRSTTIDSIGYPRMRASGESSTTKHQLLHASGPHPIPPPNDSKRLAPTSFTRKPALQTVGGGRSSIRSTTGFKSPPSICTRRSDGFWHRRKLLVAVSKTSPIT